MKKLLTVAAFCIAGLAAAQENSIKANPLAILGGSDLISYEHRLSDNISAVIGAGFGGYKIAGSKYSSAGAGIQGRYYFNEAISGFYGAAVVDFNMGKVKIDNSFGGIFIDPTNPSVTTTSAEAKWSGIGGGLRAGYQWIFDSGFTLDVNGGASYRSFNYKWDNSAQETFYMDNVKANGILPAGSIGIGYSF